MGSLFSSCWNSFFPTAQASNYENLTTQLSWHEVLRTQQQQILPYGNTPKSRVLVISGTKVNVDVSTSIISSVLCDPQLEDKSAYNEDKAHVRKLKQAPTTNKIVFEVFNLGSLQVARHAS